MMTIDVPCFRHVRSGRHLRQCVGWLLLMATTSGPVFAQAIADDPLDVLNTASEAAAAALQQGELQLADSRYRDVLREAWLMLGGLEAADGRWAEATRAFERSASATVQPREPLRLLALVHIQTGNAGEAVQILTKLVGKNAKDIPSRRLLAQALAAAGQRAEAVQELEEAAAAAPDDIELKFLLASGYLRLKKVDAADRLFEEIARRRPIPQTHVLVGRTYRDSGEYGRARTALLRALKMDPNTRRAHYYLGTVAVLEDGVLRLPEAIAEFREELRLTPDDPVANLRLGVALVEARRAEEALQPLQIATASESPSPDASFYLGRCLLALERAPEAVAALRTALQLSHATGVGEPQLAGIHYQLGLALRTSGAQDEAARHFAEAERLSQKHTELSRAYLARYLADTPDPDAVNARAPADTAFPLSAIPPQHRAVLRRRTTTELTRACFNLGVMHARAGRPARAVEFLQTAADLDPSFPQVQYSLGSAYFNAQQYDKAAAPLSEAFTANPSDTGVRRMLALAWLNAGAHDNAAELLRNDPGREAEPSLQYAYGLALLRGNRSKDAQVVFAELLARQGETPELNVVMGQAQAQERDFDAAEKLLRRAIELKSTVPEAHAALGVIYLKQGKLPEAAAALRREIVISPGDIAARHNLATVLQLLGEHEEAVALLRRVLKEQPDYADARYLLGKILLASGATGEAVEHLEAATRLAPQDANIHYQLGLAYQKLGRAEHAARAFDTFRELKDKLAGRTP